MPPYSPNLNLIERLWGCMKDRILRTHYAAFQQAIAQFFKSLDR
ncbi:hypothetical protein HC928_04220 [bacterium]|nr:hypothetical protein [bacterium]